MKKFHILSLNVLLIALVSISWLMAQDLSLLLEFKLGESPTGLFFYSVFIFDKISSAFIIMVGSVSLIVIKYAYWYMHGEKKSVGFFVVFLLFVFFMILLSMSTNLVWVILGWDGLGVTSFCLVMFFSNWKSFNSAMITFMINRFGDFFFILSIWSFFCVFFEKHLWGVLLGLFLVLTASTKSAQIPFSAWLPEAMAAPTPVSSLVHSSTLVTAGIYLLIRFFYLLNETSSTILFYFSVLTIIIAGMSAMEENDLKKIIALSTLSHLGFMMFFLSVGSVSCTIVHLLTHAFFKSLLFMGAGMLIHSSNNCQDIRQLNLSNPGLSFIILAAVSANMGLPFLSGFYSKEILIFNLFSSNLTLSFSESLALMISIILTSSYSIRVMWTLYSVSSAISVSEEGSLESTKMKNWLIVSLLLSCSIGGCLVWVMIDPSQELEFSFFLKGLKFMVFFLIGVCFFLSKKITGLSSFSQKLWFVLNFSKMVKTFSFKFSKSFLWDLDLKGFLSNKPKFSSILLKDGLFLKYPKLTFLVGVWFGLVFLYQISLMNYFLI